MKKLKIDFLYLDLSTCGRCVSTDNILQEALSELSGVLNALGYEVQLNSVILQHRPLLKNIVL